MGRDWETYQKRSYATLTLNNDPIQALNNMAIIPQSMTRIEPLQMLTPPA